MYFYRIFVSIQMVIYHKVEAILKVGYGVSNGTQCNCVYDLKNTLLQFHPKIDERRRGKKMYFHPTQMKTDHIRDVLLDRLMKKGSKRCKTLCSKIESKYTVKTIKGIQRKIQLSEFLPEQFMKCFWYKDIMKRKFKKKCQGFVYKSLYINIVIR